MAGQLPEKPKITFGIYGHYRGGQYEVSSLVFNAETDKWDVLYKKTSDGQMFTRSVDNFLSEVRFGVQRFRLLESYNMPYDA